MRTAVIETYEDWSQIPTFHKGPLVLRGWRVEDAGGGAALTTEAEEALGRDTLLGPGFYFGTEDSVSIYGDAYPVEVHFRNPRVVWGPSEGGEIDIQDLDALIDELGDLPGDQYDGIIVPNLKVFGADEAQAVLRPGYDPSQVRRMDKHGVRHAESRQDLRFEVLNIDRNRDGSMREFMVTAYQDDVYVGYIAVARASEDRRIDWQGDHYRIMSVYVEPRFRRQGLATQLLEYAREVAAPEEVRHDDDRLTDEGRAWSEVVASLQDRLGKCYVLAGRNIYEGWDLVHGSIQGWNHPRIGHAWNIKPDGKVYDPVMDQEFDPDTHRLAFKAEEYGRWDPTEAATMATKEGHWGPWAGPFMETDYLDDKTSARYDHAIKPGRYKALITMENSTIRVEPIELGRSEMVSEIYARLDRQFPKAQSFTLTDENGDIVDEYSQLKTRHDARTAGLDDRLKRYWGPERYDEVMGEITAWRRGEAMGGDRSAFPLLSRLSVDVRWWSRTPLLYRGSAVSPDPNSYMRRWLDAEVGDTIGAFMSSYSMDMREALDFAAGEMFYVPGYHTAMVIEVPDARGLNLNDITPPEFNQYEWLMSGEFTIVDKREVPVTNHDNGPSPWRAGERRYLAADSYIHIVAEQVWPISRRKLIHQHTQSQEPNAEVTAAASFDEMKEVLLDWVWAGWDARGIEDIIDQRPHRSRTVLYRGLTDPYGAWADLRPGDRVPRANITLAKSMSAGLSWTEDPEETFDFSYGLGDEEEPPVELALAPGAMGININAVIGDQHDLAHQTEWLVDGPFIVEDIKWTKAPQNVGLTLTDRALFVSLRQEPGVTREGIARHDPLEPGVLSWLEDKRIELHDAAGSHDSPDGNHPTHCLMQCDQMAWAAHDEFGWDVIQGSYKGEDRNKGWDFTPGYYDHYWNQLPDGTWVDATADQFGDQGTAVRVMPPGDPAREDYVRAGKVSKTAARQIIKGDNDYAAHRVEKALKNTHPQTISSDLKFDDIDDIWGWVYARIWRKEMTEPFGVFVEPDLVQYEHETAAFCVKQPDGSFVLVFKALPVSLTVLLHEVAHALVWDEVGGSHGLDWADTFLTLMREYNPSGYGPHLEAVQNEVKNISHVQVEGAKTVAGPFYHVTMAQLEPGDVIAPGKGPSPFEGATDPEYAYAADASWLDHWKFEIADWAAGFLDEYRPEWVYVYRVEPVGEYEPDPNFGSRPGNVRSREGWRIVALEEKVELPDDSVYGSKEAANQRGLDELFDDGYCIEGWGEWQQGLCGTYATALMELDPSLRFGGIDFDNDPGFDNPTHFVAHDDEYAYDSAGRHPLPYEGVHGGGRWLPDHGTPEHFGLPQDEVGEDARPYIEAAKEHAIRNGILEGRHERQAAKDLPEALEGYVGDISMEIVHAAVELVGGAEGWSSGGIDDYHREAARLIFEAMEPHSGTYWSGQPSGRDYREGQIVTIPMMSAVDAEQIAHDWARGSYPDLAERGDVRIYEFHGIYGAAAGTIDMDGVWSQEPSDQYAEYAISGDYRVLETTDTHVVLEYVSPPRVSRRGAIVPEGVGLGTMYDDGFADMATDGKPDFNSMQHFTLDEGVEYVVGLQDGKNSRKERCPCGGVYGWTWRGGIICRKCKKPKKAE